MHDFKASGHGVETWNEGSVRGDGRRQDMGAWHRDKRWEQGVVGWHG